jgi:hypothetical protein
VSLAEGEAIGYHPLDDAEQFAPEVIAQYGTPDPADLIATRLGGTWCANPMGQAW